MGRLQNKVAVVTGAGAGIGASSARRFAAEGAQVLVADINAKAAEGVAVEIRQAGGIAAACATDVGDEAQVKAMIETCLSTFGGVDILFNNATNTNMEDAARHRDLFSFDAALFEKYMRINVLGGIWGCKYAIPHMLARGKGSVIFTSSTASLGADPLHLSYGATKAAVNWYVKTFAATYGKQGIRTNAILPGVVMTDSQKAASPFPGMFEAYLEAHQSPRLGEPADIAALALFLASDEAFYINGSLINADGGMTTTIPVMSAMERIVKANS